MGAIFGAFKKATSGDDVTPKKRKASTKQGGFLGTLLASVAAPLITSALGIGGGAGRAGKGLMLPGWVGAGRNEAEALKPPTILQIDGILENRWVAKYRGTYSKDTLPHKPKVSKSLVINLEDLMVMQQLCGNLQ